MAETYTAHNQQGLLLNANENPDNLSLPIREQIAKALMECAFNRYPPDGAPELRKAYGKWIGLEPEWILAGNGSDQMLQVAISTFIKPDGILMTLDPDFGMYDFYCHQSSGQMEKFPVNPDGSFDLDAFIARAREIRPQLILFSNPNNPSGHLISKEQVKALLDALPKTPIIMDEAYMEFAQDSALNLLQDYSNLYITRTLSKMFGLAAMRTGFLLSQPANIEILNENRPVYNLSTPAQIIGTILLEHADEYETKRDVIIEQRKWLSSALSDLEGVEVYPSAANFICVKLDRQKELTQALEKEQIQIRTYPKKDYVRITIGKKEDNQRVLDVFKTIYAGKEKA